MQVFRVFQTSIDELFELAVDFWHKLREGKLLWEGKLEEMEQRLSKILLKPYFTFCTQKTLTKV